MKEARIGVYFCTRSSGSTKILDFKALAAYAGKLPQVVEVKNLGVAPALDPLVLAKELTQKRLTAVVIGADSPGYFKTAFTRALALAGADLGVVCVSDISADVSTIYVICVVSERDISIDIATIYVERIACI